MLHTYNNMKPSSWSFLQLLKQTFNKMNSSPSMPVPHTSIRKPQQKGNTPSVTAIISRGFWSFCP